MLKRYETPERLQWVGRAWEIRHALRQEVKQRGGGSRLADMLPQDAARSRENRINHRQKGAVLRFPAP